MCCAITVCSGRYFHEQQSVRSTIEGRFDLSVKTALIAEGGGQRGIFTAGVLDAWLENDFDPFDLFIGTSSGSQNITSFLSRQKGYAKQLIRSLSRQKRFYKLGRGLVGGNVVDLDWYFDKTIKLVEYIKCVKKAFYYLNEGDFSR